MTLIEKVGDFLRALDHTVEEKDRHFLLAEQPGLGGERDQHFVWVLTRDMRQHRPGPVVEDEYLTRFKGIAQKYPGARLHLIVDTIEGLSQGFRTDAKRLYGVSVQVPAQFFDLEFKYEVARNSISAVADLVKEAEASEIKRVPQTYARDGADLNRSDIVPDLLAEIDAALPHQDAQVWFI